MRPSAPRLQEIISQGIYGSEQGCDVVFLVGPNDETWRIPAHKAILEISTPVFKAMFSTNFYPNGLEDGQPHTVIVTDVDGKAFDNLMKHLYAQEVRFHSVDSALRTLFAAHKYQCPELVKKCVDYLHPNLSVGNILCIISNVPLLCGHVQNRENINKERGLIDDVLIISDGDGDVQMQFEDFRGTEDLDSMENECARLLKNCLEFVDKEANAVLQLEEMEDLDPDTFRLILSRDTLDISNEDIVFNTILRWTDKECKRQRLPLTLESKRKVLGELRFLPRYLTMTLPSFLDELGPAKSGILTKEEVECLVGILRKGISKELQAQGPDTSPQNAGLGIPTSLRPFYRMISRPRCPCKSIGALSPVKKSKRGISFAGIFRRRRCCRRKSRSQLSSPANSNPSSPQHENDDHSKKWDHCVERVVVFLACLFD